MLGQGIVNFIWNLRRSAAEPYPNVSRVPRTPRTQAGVVVTPDRALLNDTVWAAHRYLTQTVAQLPAKIMLGGGKSPVRVYNHPVDNVLNWRAAPEWSPFQLRETLTSWAILRGNGCAEIEKDGVGRVVALHPIEPWRLDFVRDKVTKELLYKVDMGSGKEPLHLRSDEVFHIRGFGDRPVGLSVIEYAAQTIGWARATELFGASFFGNGMHFGGTAIVKGKADADTVERIREELEASYRGPSRGSKWFVGDDSMTVTRTSATPDEAQFVSTLQFQVESICRWMGVPPHKVMHLLRSTFSNIEHQSIEVVGDAIVPWAMRWEQEAGYKLFGQNRTNLYVVFEVKGLLRGSYKERQEGLQIQRRNGIINADEWRDHEDLGPFEGEGGEIYIVEKNMVELNKVGLVADNASDTSTTGDGNQTSSESQVDSQPPTSALASLRLSAAAEQNLIEAERYLDLSQTVLEKIEAAV